LRVGSFRKAAKVPYPNAYATALEASTSPEKHAFNCAQRAHANFIENQPSFLATLLVAGLVFPVASAALGAVWIAGRATYAWGYTRPHKPNGSGRYLGVWWYVPDALLKLMAPYAAYTIATQGGVWAA
jgi:glutathione S-transferase